MIRRIRSLTVKNKIQLTPNMMRIVLGGSDLSDFPSGQESGYIKLLFPSAGKTLKRSYTIRAFNAKSQELTIDCVAHGDHGPASAWVMNSQVGDAINIDGPGAKKLVDNNADWFFLAGDMTALPAISANLEQLPEIAKGYAVLEILDADDYQNIQTAKGMEVFWVINSSPDEPNTILADQVKAMRWLDGNPSVWVASEFETMRNLRSYFKQERQIDQDKLYMSSYWKMGETDEGNKLAKKLDSEV